jgi:ubiquinone/menaquinone biosynthesis C-methylase UbiE
MKADVHSCCATTIRWLHNSTFLRNLIDCGSNGSDPMAATAYRIPCAVESKFRIPKVLQGPPTHALFCSLDEICDRYLRITPLSLALFRYAELQHLHQIPLQRPVLDLGCGTGLFASAAVELPIDIGVDISSRALRRGSNPRWYHETLCADARCMPLQSNSIGTVISISVLEHIERIEELLSEVHRVLIPNGCFAATVVLNDIHRGLFYPSFLRRTGLGVVGSLYERGHDRVFRHVTLLSEAQWRAALGSAGFDVVQCRRVISLRVARWFDALLATAWPYRILTELGFPAVPRPAWWRRSWQRRFKAWMAAPCDDGVGLFFVARKPDAPIVNRFAGHC